jgi:hypothetical protein
MRTNEIENWALSVIDRVNAGQPVEDQRVELKADWIPPDKAARQIAALANALHGEPGLWLVGVDETRGVQGVTFVEVANWFPQVASMFDGLVPDPTIINVPVAGKTVAAFLFDTERAPFVVRVEKTGYLEVPWRGSTQTRSARREELLRLLSPLQRMPDLEVFGAAVEMERPGGGAEKMEVWRAALMVFANTRGDTRVVIPFHRCTGVLTFPNQNFTHAFTKFQIKPGLRNPGTILASATEAVLNGPGTFLLNAQLEIPRRGGSPGGDAHVKFNLHLADFDRTAVITSTIPIALLGEQRWQSGEATSVFDQDEFFFA